MSAYYACFDRNLTATGCLSLSLCVPLRELEPEKSAVLSPPVPPCPPVSLKENDYESEGRRFESCRARHKKMAGFQDKCGPTVSLQLHELAILCLLDYVLETDEANV